MNIGEVWEDQTKPFVGRRGIIASIGEYIVLLPTKGNCPCPLKQRKTSIRRDRFLRAWRQL